MSDHATSPVPFGPQHAAVYDTPVRFVQTLLIHGHFARVAI